MDYIFHSCQSLKLRLATAIITCKDEQHIHRRRNSLIIGVTVDGENGEALSRKTKSVVLFLINYQSSRIHAKGIDKIVTNI